ncbi:MAG: helicase-related protein [Pseudomonadota bacterium]
MPETLTVQYSQSGTSVHHNNMGMREMQARAYAGRNAQHLLLKAPPASGKSRALMFLALDKVLNQGLAKAIIAVPEISIGSSFDNTNLSKYGFFADWCIDPEYSLCTPGGAGKVDKVLAFLADPQAQYLLCTHATLRFAFERMNNPHAFDNVLIAIDEFHHTSAEEGNKLGAMVDALVNQSTAHLVAMTGSYFRGDQVPILNPEIEARFTHISYTYYEQLNGYKHLKSLGLGYHFYQGSYLSAIAEVLDIHKKTIIHIPNVNSAESTGRKLYEVDAILDAIGDVVGKDKESGILTLKTADGTLIKVADLVTDDQARANVLTYLRSIKERDQMDIIIALGMAKEGFDWPWCEHVLTIGYRSSLTEVVQIIGRAARDCAGKSHAQFTNLIAQPDAEDEDVKDAVNNVLKAITLSLLMREVLAPSVNFRPRSTIAVGEEVPANTVIIDDSEKPVSPKVRSILENGGVDDILTQLINKPETINPVVTGQVDPKELTEVDLPKIVTTMYPDLPAEDVLLLSDLAKTKLVISANGGIIPADDVVIDDGGYDGDNENGGQDDGDEEDGDNPRMSQGARAFLRIGDRLIDVDNLQIDLIESINPFQGAYEILSKSVTAPMLKTIQDNVTTQRSDVTEEEAVLLWPKIREFKKQYGVEPSLSSSNGFERRLAEVLAFIRYQKAQRMAQEA